MYEFALNSLRHNTLDDKSLLVELGLLFDMLSKANGQHVAAINFVKTLSAIPEANALGIIVDDANPLHNLDNLTAINAGIISGGSAPGGSSIDSNNRIEFNGSTAVVTLFGRSFRIPSSFLRQSSTTSSGSASSDLRNDNNNATGSIDQFSISATIMHSQGLILQSFSRFCWSVLLLMSVPSIRILATLIMFRELRLEQIHHLLHVMPKPAGTVWLIALKWLHYLKSKFNKL